MARTVRAVRPTRIMDARLMAPSFLREKRIPAPDRGFDSTAPIVEFVPMDDEMFDIAFDLGIRVR